MEKEKCLKICRELFETTPIDNDLKTGGRINHKLAVIEVFLDEYWQGMKESRNLDDYHEEFNKALQDGKCNKSKEIDIYNTSYVEDDKIHLVAYLHGTDIECDVSYPTFTYDDKLKHWIVKEDFWGAPNGIDCNFNVLLLDFSGYNSE